MPEASFAGSIPELYDRHLGRLLMVPFGKDLANRLPVSGLADVLELAAGTGVVTELLRDRLSESTRLVATDISEGMLKVAQARQMAKKVEWKVADATSLPFDDDSFDLVVIQFGVMFFPDKEKSMQEIFRVLRPGGRVLFNVWDKIEFNDFPRIANEIIAQMFDNDPPAFYQLPFGFHDHFAIRTMLRNAGFNDIALTTIEMKLEADAADAAKGLVEGNPIVDEIRNLGKEVKDATERVERAIANELGQKVAKGQARAIVVGARKSADAPLGKTSSKAQAKPKSTKPKTTTGKAK